MAKIKMKLYYSPGSPYARKVRVVALETKLDKKIEMVNVALSPVAPNADVDKHNPVGKIPVLSVKGIDLFDSPVICEYLDNQHKGRKLLPRKGRDRWVALRQQAMADGLLDAALLARYEAALRPEDKRWSDWSQGQMKKINSVLDQLEAEAKALKGKPTLGSISVACALGYLDFRFAANDWRSKHPKLAKWFNSFSKTPSIKATVPPPA
jgi:glutathione S-transferase